MNRRQSWMFAVGSSVMAWLATDVWAFGEARGIDGFRAMSGTRYQVFSERGIGAFNLIAQPNASHKVCFFYAEGKPFTRLEGITITRTTAKGDRSLTDFKVRDGCVKFRFRNSESQPLQIEFVDMYRG